MCVDFWERNGPDFCNSLAEEGEECLQAQEAHDLLKWEAKEAARAAYDHWLAKGVDNE
jgi:hypothetical protein